MSQKTVKVAITGAAGQICYSALFNILSGQAFGPNTKIKLQLLELEAALPRLEGVVMEIEDCAFDLLDSVEITSDPSVAFSGANWALLVGAMPRGPGMERSDLLQANKKIFEVQGAFINDYAADDVKILVVGNPCNTNAAIAMNNAKDIPQDRFFAMTMLDQNRARTQLAIKAGVSTVDVTRVSIWGNHSATQFPDFYHARIKGEPVIEVIDENWLKKTFVPMIQKRGAAVISARKSSSAASAANGIIETVACIEGVHPESYSCFSVALASQGEYGVKPGTICSYPCKLNDLGSVEVIQGWEHGDFASNMFEKSLSELYLELNS